MFACCLAYALLMIMTSSVVSESGACHFHAQSLPIAMYAHQGIFGTPNNAVYLFGGYSGTNWGDRVDLSKVYKWDLNDPSSWFVEIGSIPAQLFNSWIQNAVLVKDLVFFIGVEHANWRDGTMFVFDLKTESFLAEQKMPMSIPLTGGCLTTNTTHIFMVDGNSMDGAQRLPIIQVYDVAADAWQSRVLDTGPSTNGGWYSQYCSLVGSALYVLGGYAASYRDEIYRINTLTLEMEELSATLPAPQVSGASIVDADQHLFLFGAYPFKSDVELLDLETLSVSTAFASQQSYASAPVLAVNGSIYRFGGRRFETDKYYALDQVEICDLPTDMPTFVSTPAPLQQQPTRPSPPTNDEYGVDTTIKLDAQNDTKEKEVQVEGIYDSKTKSDDDDSSSSNGKNDWLIIVLVVLVVLLSAALIRKCYVERKISKPMEHVQDEDDGIANHDADETPKRDQLDNIYVDRGQRAARATTKEIGAEIFDAIHSFNARQARNPPMVAVMASGDDGEDDELYGDEDDELYDDFEKEGGVQIGDIATTNA